MLAPFSRFTYLFHSTVDGVLFERASTHYWLIAACDDGEKNFFAGVVEPVPFYTYIQAIDSVLLYSCFLLPLLVITTFCCSIYKVLGEK